MRSSRKEDADDFRPMKYYPPPEQNQVRPDGALDSGRKSNSSFAEAV
jgi:hypothetical protein